MGKVGGNRLERRLMVVVYRRVQWEKDGVPWTETLKVINCRYQGFVDYPHNILCAQPEGANRLGRRSEGKDL
jgi:hypothetical protein